MFAFRPSSVLRSPNQLRGGRPMPRAKKTAGVDALGPRQKKVLDFILETVEERGYPPSVREIADAVGLASPSTVHAPLEPLQKKGYIRKDATKPRAIAIS